MACMIHRSDLDKLEELYNSMSKKCDDKHKEHLQDYDQWQLSLDALLKHIEDLKTALNKQQQSQANNIQNQIDDQNKKRDEINASKGEMNKLRGEIKDLKQKLEADQVHSC